jgi:hypothetical protein
MNGQGTHQPGRQHPQPGVPLRYATPGEPTCEAPGCAQALERATTGRPARFCSPACRARYHRAAQRAQLVSVEVDFGSASSRGRPPERAWMVRLRRGQRSVIVTIGLTRAAADRLAAQLTDLLAGGPP